MTYDQKRAFNYSVGINDKQMNRKNEALLEGFLDTNEPSTSPMFFLMFGTMASSGFQSAHSTSSAATGSGSAGVGGGTGVGGRSEEHTSELQSRGHLVCRLLLEK